MITLPIISRIIGPERYGVINYSFAFVGYFILIINAGFDFYGTRMILQNRGNKIAINNLLSRIIITKGLLLVISALIFFSSLFLIPQLAHEKMVAFYTFLVCIGWVINPSWLYHGMQDSRKYAVFSFISKLLFSIVVILLIRHPKDYFFHPLLYSLSHILISWISFSYATRKYGLKIHSLRWVEIATTIKDNKHLSVIWWITNQSLSTNIVLAGFMLSTIQIGFFSAALRIIIIIQSIISMPLNTVLFPYIGEAFVEGNEQGIDRVHKSFPYVFFISVLMCLGTFLFSNEVILLFYGKQFTESILLLKISSVVLLFATLNSALGQQVMLNLKKDAVYVKVIVAGLILNIFLLFALINLYGISGAAYAWPTSEILIFIFYCIYFKWQHINMIKAQYYTPKYLYQNIMTLFKMKAQKI